jgi:glycosyltransferase involved in cell wall biosynthesis
VQPVSVAQPLRGLRVCQFGHFDPDYARNRIVAKALRRAGAEVIQVLDGRRFDQRAPALLARAGRERFDLLLVGFPGHSDVPLARLLAATRRVPLVFDAFVSLYDSAVFSYGTTPAGSLAAWRYFWLDRVACRLADLVLLDTQAHIEYFARTFGLRRSRFRRLWAGADDELMYPSSEVPRTAGPLRVFCYATFSPLHGTEHIVQAAQALGGEQVAFTLVGSGPTLASTRALADELGLEQVCFRERVATVELRGLMAASDVCLGVFGTVPKTGRVIPNKVFDGLAVRRPVLSADTPALREALVAGRDVLTCEAGSGESLAAAIVCLSRDADAREQIAANGYRRFRQHFSLDALAGDLASIVREVMGG